MKNDSLAGFMFEIGVAAIRPTPTQTAEMEDLARDAMRGEAPMSEEDVGAYARTLGE